MDQKNNKALLQGICYFCIIGAIVIVVLMIHGGIYHKNIPKIPYAGQVFSIFILVGLWSIKKLQRNNDLEQSSYQFVIKVIFATYGIAGALYIIIFIMSLFCCGSEGTRFISENIIAIILLGVSGSLYFVLKKLKQ